MSPTMRFVFAKRSFGLFIERGCFRMSRRIVARPLIFVAPAQDRNGHPRVVTPPTQPTPSVTPMTMKSQIRSAYVAGLSPLQLLMNDWPGDHRKIEPAPACDQPSADLPRRSWRRKRALLLILTLGFAIGA